MRIATVESTTLATVGYDETRKLLQLEFLVGLSTFTSVFLRRCTKRCSTRLRRARYFNGAIRGRYPYRRVLSFFHTVPQGAEIAAGCDR